MLTKAWNFRSYAVYFGMTKIKHGKNNRKCLLLYFEALPFLLCNDNIQVFVVRLFYGCVHQNVTEFGYYYILIACQNLEKLCFSWIYVPEFSTLDIRYYHVMNLSIGLLINVPDCHEKVAGHESPKPRIFFLTWTVKTQRTCTGEVTQNASAIKSKFYKMAERLFYVALYGIFTFEV